MVIGVAALTTTTVRGFAAATWRMQVDLLGRQVDGVASMPSVTRSSCPTTTTATSASAAACDGPLDGVGLRRRAGRDGQAGDRDRTVGRRGVELGDHLVGRAGDEVDLALDRAR